VHCRKPVPHNAFTLDHHLTPKSIGGGKTQRNLMLSCYACNSARADAPVSAETLAYAQPYIERAAALALLAPYVRGWEELLPGNGSVGVHDAPPGLEVAERAPDVDPAADPDRDVDPRDFRSRITMRPGEQLH
jgi:hypothetical protein